MVDLAKRGIIRIYQDDFQKLDPTGRLETLFMEIPSQLSQTNTRYKPFTVLGDIDDEKLMELMNNLDDSKTVLFSYHSNDPNVGMSLTKNISKYKIFCADTGLFVTLALHRECYLSETIERQAQHKSRLRLRECNCTGVGDIRKQTVLLHMAKRRDT